jgi:NodT family efflux transporter outer membrane factor (OMF) lipoprotein
VIDLLRELGPKVLALMVVGGCAAAPPPRAPSPPLAAPAEYVAPKAEAEPAGGLQDLWWQSFGDARLDELVAEALRENRDLAIAAARVEAAAAEARIAGADRYPSVGVGVSGRRAKQNFIGFPIPGAGDQVLSTTSTNVALSLDVSWEADLWGRLRARQQAAVAELEAARVDRAGAELSLSGLAVRGWFLLVEAGQQVALAERTLDTRERSRSRVEARYRRGLSNSLDLRLARSEESLARSALEQRRRERQTLTRRLEVLLGRYPAALVEAPAELPALPAPVPVGLPSDLVTRRPDLAALELRLAAAGARVAEARRALYPRLSLTGSGGTASDSLADLLKGDFSVWSLAGGLLQPLFQGGRLRAGVDLASAGEMALLAEYVQSALEAFQDVEEALAAERFLALQVESLDVAAEESAKAEQLALTRYSEGLESYLSVLEAQRQSFLSEAQLLARRRDRLVARVELILALGGSFASSEEALALAQLHQREP